MFTLLPVLLLLSPCMEYVPGQDPVSLPILTGGKGVQGMNALKSALLPKDWKERLKAGKKPGDFDPNQFFKVLNHLSMQPDYVLDYVYSDESLGSRPILYAYSSTAKPLKDYQAYSHEIQIKPEAKEALSPAHHIRADGTPEGFFQLALLRLMGEQFYLEWHANYNDLAPVCGKESLEDLLDRMSKSSFGVPMSPETIIKARALRVDPIVRLDAQSATVWMVTFSKWGGFSRLEITFQRAFPHKVLKSDSRSLVKYDCGMNF